MVDKKHFWTQIEDIPDGYGYGQFSFVHFLYLAFTVASTVVLCIIYNKADLNTRLSIRKVIAVTLLISEIVKLLVIYFNHNKVTDYLPLEVCSFAGYSIIADAFIPNTEFLTMMQLTIFLPAAIMALLYPTTIALPAINFFTFHQFIYHGLIVAYIMMRFTASEIIINYNNVIMSIIAIFIIFIIVYFIDITFNKNFMFLTKDEGSSLLKKIYDFSGGGHKYRGALVVLSIIVIHVFFIIFKIIQLLFIH